MHLFGLVVLLVLLRTSDGAGSGLTPIKQQQLQGGQNAGMPSKSSSSSMKGDSRRHDEEEEDDPLLPPGSGVSNALIKKLFSNFHKAAQLVRPLIVHMDVLLIKVKSTIEKEGIFESVIAIFIEWQDKRLQWDPNKYANISYLSLDPDQVGLPDIAMTNSADHLYSITRDHRFNVRVRNDGLLKYVPTGTARTWCDLKLTTFPFDFQKCSLEFESWSLDNQSMTFDGTSELLLDTSFVSQLWTICQWKAVTYDHTYFTNETFTRLRFDISVKRKSTFYIVNLIFPCATLSMIQMAVYIISLTDTTTDRIGFGTTNLLTLVVFQTIVTEEMPKTSDAVTALSKYVIALICLSAIGIFESVAVERILSTSNVPPPRLLQCILRYVPIIWRERPDKLPAEDFLTCCDEDDYYQGRADDDSCYPATTMMKNITTATTLLDSPITAPKKIYNEDSESNLSPILDGVFHASKHRKSASGTNLSKHAEEVTPNTQRRLSYEWAITEANRRISQKINSIYQQPNVAEVLVGSQASQNVAAKLANYFKRSNSNIANQKPSPGVAIKNGKAGGYPLVDVTGPPKRSVSINDNVNQIYYPYSNGNCNKAAKSRRHQRVPSKLTLGFKARNSRLWKEVAFKVDVITFVICAFLALFIPGSLFIPLIFFDSHDQICNGPGKN